MSYRMEEHQTQKYLYRQGQHYFHKLVQNILQKFNVNYSLTVQNFKHIEHIMSKSAQAENERVKSEAFGIHKAYLLLS